MWFIPAGSVPLLAVANGLSQYFLFIFNRQIDMVEQVSHLGPASMLQEQWCSYKTLQYVCDHIDAR